MDNNKTKYTLSDNSKSFIVGLIDGAVMGTTAFLTYYIANKSSTTVTKSVVIGVGAIIEGLEISKMITNDSDTSILNFKL